MNKFLKISVTFLLFIFIFFVENAYAANVDLNLASNLVDTNTNSNVSNTNIISNTISNDTSSNTSANTNAISGTSDSTTESGTATFSNVSSLPESELGLTNILNILLITVGVVLILLSIAILIRLKN